MPQASPSALRSAERERFARRSLWSIGGASSALVLVLYAVAVATPWGQRLDTVALRGRHLLSTHDIHIAQRVHTTLDVVSIILFGGAIILVALLRERPRLAVGIATIFCGSLLTSELLKRLVPRPTFAVVDPLKHASTFPSGHTTIAMALSVGAILAVPIGARNGISIVGVVFTGAVGCSLVATASHRPSDVIGAILVVTAWAAGVGGCLAHSDARPSATEPLWARMSPWMAGIGGAFLAAAFLSAVIVEIAIHRGDLNTVELGRAFVGAASAIIGFATLCTAALLVALHGIDLDAPRGERPLSRPSRPGF